MARSNLQLRLLTAAVGLPVLIGLIFLGGWPYAAVAGVVALLATAEFAHGWLLPSRPIRSVVTLGPALAVPAIMVAGAHQSAWFPLVGAIGAAFIGVAGLSHLNLFGPRKPLRVLAGAYIYFGLLLAAMVLIRDFDDGRHWIFLGLLSTFAVDTGAYATGKALGRHKMAPSVSPGKTWEGAIGGYACGMGAAYALNELLGLNADPWTFAYFALPFPAFAIAGDLFESWMKRRMGIKDASGLLPGHGGFMDRLDSVLFVMPLLYVFLELRIQ